MKRVILGVAATAAAVSAAVLIPQAAGATGGGGSGTEVLINDKADYDTFGTALDLGFQVKCTSPAGEAAITASVSQSPPETASPVSLSTGMTMAVCDGKYHSVAVTVLGAGYDAGKATATVTVVPVLGSPTKTATKCITIVNV